MLKIRFLPQCSLVRGLAWYSSAIFPKRRRPVTGSNYEQSSQGEGPSRRDKDLNSAERRSKRGDPGLPRDEKVEKPVRLRRRTTFPIKNPSQGEGAEQPSSGRVEEGGVEQAEGSSTDKRKEWVKNVHKIRMERYNKQVQNLVRRGKVTEAAGVLEKMRKSRLRPDVVIYNNVILGYSRVGEFKLAFKLFNELKKRALLPTDHTYSSMFAACGAAGPPALEVLQKVRNEMERRDVHLNTITTNALMSALARCGKHNEAVQIYMDMDKLRVQPDIFTYGGLLTIMAKDKSNGVGVAQGVWSEMAKSAIVPDLHCHNMILQVLRDGGLEGVVKDVKCAPDKPPKILELPSMSADELKLLVGQVQLSKSEMVVDSEAKDDVTKSKHEHKRKKGEKKKEKHFIEIKKMEEHQTIVKDDIENVAAAKDDVGGDAEPLSKDDSVDAGFVAATVNKSRVPRLRSKDVPVGPVIYLKGEVTFALSRGHRLVLKVGSDRPQATQSRVRWLEKSSLEAFFAFMKKNRVKPDIHTFHLLGHLTPDHTHLLVTMQERKVLPDAKFMVALITQHSKCFRNLQGALALMEYSRGLGLKLGQPGYQALAACCTKEKEALHVLDIMKEDGVKPEHQLVGTLIGHAVRDHSYELLTTLIREMMILDMKPNPVILQMLATAAAREPKSERQRKRLNGFKGFYKIWKDKVCPEEKKEEEYVVV